MAIDRITGAKTTGDSEEVSKAVKTWFIGAPTDVQLVIDSLEGCLDRHEDTGEVEAFLNISLTVESP